MPGFVSLRLLSATPSVHVSSRPLSNLVPQLLFWCWESAHSAPRFYRPLPVSSIRTSSVVLVASPPEAISSMAITMHHLVEHRAQLGRQRNRWDTNSYRNVSGSTSNSPTSTTTS